MCIIIEVYYIRARMKRFRSMTELRDYLNVSMVMKIGYSSVISKVWQVCDIVCVCLHNVDENM